MEVPPWIAVVITLATPVCLGIWQAYQFITKRHDDLSQRRELQDDKHLDLMTRQREQLAAENTAVFNAVRAELDRKGDLLDDCEADRHRGWERARFWYAQAWTMAGRAAQARQIAESAAKLASMPPPTWGDGALELPPFDGPTAKPP